MSARSEILGWIAARAGDILADVSDVVDVADRLAVAEALDAPAFAAEILDLARILGESTRSPSAFGQLLLVPDFDTDVGRDGVTLISAVAMAIAIGRVSWPSRPAARKARSSFVERAHAAYAVTAALGPELHMWLAGLVAVAVRLVSDLAANATPMVHVESGVSLPSTVIAYHLYGDAKRAQGLVDISGSATPLIMPSGFEALAS